MAAGAGGCRLRVAGGENKDAGGDPDTMRVAERGRTGSCWRRLHLNGTEPAARAPWPESVLTDSHARERAPRPCEPAQAAASGSSAHGCWRAPGDSRRWRRGWRRRVFSTGFPVFAAASEAGARGNTARTEGLCAVRWRIASGYNSSVGVERNEGGTGSGFRADRARDDKHCPKAQLMMLDGILRQALTLLLVALRTLKSAWEAARPGATCKQNVVSPSWNQHE
ncbi:uncharacterized protein BXZ73DRAFT_78814 [Epithele typhae]|uniref:uncharacterized protein n=1 Tax=Epithele typhae TaxID=378194 RepID=UPI0020073BAB|nr:uncharacterized protein BXZ73DRAFT_78814 [Epithele typhae]KAH9926311.1 hypothetical protein BXZ73DRAFT_78814 [Epithele typhae]